MHTDTLRAPRNLSHAHDDHDDPELRRLLRRGLALLVLGLGGVLGWAAFAPVDQAVPGSGTVGVAGQRKAVQHLSGGSVAQLAVREGDSVTQGQMLLRLDVAPQRSELASVQRQQLALAAARERLSALLAGRSPLVFSAALQAQARALDDGERSLAVQLGLFESQRQGTTQERRQLGARSAQLQAEIGGRETQIVRQAEQRRLVEEQVATLEGLTRDGYYPKLRLLDMQRQAALAQQDEARGQADLQRARQGLVEAASALDRRAAEARRDWETELLEGERQAAALQSRAATLAHQIAHSEIVAPASGKVVALAVHTEGGVVEAGQTLMEIVPGDDALLVEARFALGAGEKLAPGQRADLRFTSMDQARTPVLSGEVLTVSADRLEDRRSGEPYLLVRVAVPAAERARLERSGALLRPGLPVEVFVALGERSMLALLTKPLTDRLRRAFVD